MDRRNFMISMAVSYSGLCGIAGCGSAPPAPVVARTAPRQPPAASVSAATAPPVGEPEPQGANALDTVLAADTDPRRNELALIALSQLGTPYAWGGQAPSSGFDCSGLVAYVYRQACHLALPRVAQDQARLAREIPHAEARVGDLVFYNTLGMPFSHVGIYLGEQRFVHAPTTGSVVQIAHMTHLYWQSRYNGTRRAYG